MSDIIQSLYNVVLMRKTDPQEGSYTCYLFDKGLDKILKKVSEETGETIIAAKNGDKTELINEICDLIYHLLVLAVEREVPLDDILGELDERAKKIGNLKTAKTVDKNT